MNQETDSASIFSITIGLNAAIIAVRALTPMVLEVHLPQDVHGDHKKPQDPVHPDAEAGAASSAASSSPEPQAAQKSAIINDLQASLPFGPFEPARHRTLEAGLRGWVRRQTGLRLGYVEQLYTFGDRGRRIEAQESDLHEVSIGYLALTQLAEETEDGPGGQLERFGGRWRSWYSHFPWEDWREDRPALLDAQLLPALRKWAASAPDDGNRPLSPMQRLRLSFGIDGAVWDEERVLERYELLYEAGLVLEHYRDRGETPPPDSLLLGQPMQMDHRRILATAISRLRSKLKYRPVIFELLQDSFTLTQLQETVEAISGRHLHKQNFRRLVEQGQLVEPTGATSTRTGGRPAKLYRFRRSVLVERPAPGLRFGSANKMDAS
ncbi:NAD regulator [uncultured Cohaesibacter sp.]|uniref:NUDIX hydrolase n=1 Tax=uncultured Cohaesibacter sp. TaxID=1002546 RepID=UPI0029C6BC28|nr:NAD regulator [uncultured Cohaesibacter sp.]